MRAAYAEALALRRAVGDKAGEAYVLKNLAETEYRAGHHARARELVDQVLVLARETGNRYLESMALLQSAMLKAKVGELEGAREQCLEAMAPSVMPWPGPKGGAPCLTSSASPPATATSGDTAAFRLRVNGGLTSSAFTASRVTAAGTNIPARD